MELSTLLLAINTRILGHKLEAMEATLLTDHPELYEKYNREAQRLVREDEGLAKMMEAHNVEADRLKREQGSKGVVEAGHN